MNRKVALIGDLALNGASSISTMLPVVTAFGDRASILFNSYLSNTVGYDDKEKFDNSVNFHKTISSWKKNSLLYDAVITSYIDNPDDILDVREYVSDLKIDKPSTFLLVDPAFADNGKLYCNIENKHIENYKRLIEVADLITPNLSEACFLAGESFEDYRDKYITIKYENDKKEHIDELSKKVIESIFPLVDKLRIKKNQMTIITGIEMYNAVLTVLDVFDGDHGKRQTTCNYSMKLDGRNGTGELFDAMYLETCLLGFSVVDALSITTSFIYNSLRYDNDTKMDKREGIVFEPILYDNVTAIRNKYNEMRKAKA